MSEGPLILALDQSSTQTGIALGRPEGPVALSSYSNPKCGEDYGRAFEAYTEWLDSQLDGVDLLAFEQPVRPHKNLNLHTARLLYGIAGQIELVARRRGIRAIEVDNNEMKKLIYGKGGPKPEGWLGKKLARKWGFEPQNMDECDAAGVFLFAIQHQFPDAFDVWFRRRAAA